MTKDLCLKVFTSRKKGKGSEGSFPGKRGESLGLLKYCTAQVVGIDDVAVSYNIGVLNGMPGWQKGRKLGGSCSRQSLRWRAPISSIPKPVVTEFVS